MTPEQEVIRGGRAREILDSELFIEAKRQIRAGIEGQMAKVAIADEKMHTRLILTLQLWNALERYFETARETGDLAAFQIQQDEERKKRFSFPGFR